MSSSTENPVADDDADLLQAGYRYALSLTHRSHDAEDYVQEAWMKLCQRYGRVESRAVLFTSVRNLHIDRCRRAKIVAFESLEERNETSTEAAAPAGEEPGVSGDLEVLLAGLHDGEREVIFLHYVQGYTAEEIGSLTERPRGTVLSLMSRAVARLRARAEQNPRTFRNRMLLWFVSFL